MGFLIDKHRAQIFERAVCKRFGFDHVDEIHYDGISVIDGIPRTLEVKSNLQKQSGGYKIELIDPLTKNVNPPGKGSDYVAFTRKFGDRYVVSFWDSINFKRRILGNISHGLNRHDGWSLIMTGDRGDCLCLCVDHSIIEDERYADTVEIIEMSEFIDKYSNE